jgi:hypothetical protein
MGTVNNDTTTRKKIMDAKLEQLANEVLKDAEKMEFKTEKQIDDFIKSLDENNDD